MTVRARAVGSVGGVLILLVAARISVAADQDAVLQQITSLNKGAIAAYSDGDFDKSKGLLLQALALSKKDPELQTHPLMARTYLHLGVVYVDGLDDRGTGVRYFAKALTIRPDITMTPDLATKSVTSAFEEARAQAKGRAPAEEAAASKEPVTREHGPKGKAATADRGKPAKDSADDDEEAEEKPAPRLTAAEKRKAAEEAKRAAAEERKQASEEAKQAAAEERKAAAEEKKAAADEKKKAAEAAKRDAVEEKRAAREAKEKDRQAREEQEKTLKELARAQANEAKERAAKEKLQEEKDDRERQLADTKAGLARLQKDAKDGEKQSQAEYDKLAKELTQTKDSEAKERAAKEKAQAEKADRERQLADAKATIQQLQKAEADKQKQIADGAAREKRERDAKEKLERDKQAADAREKERKAAEQQAQAERDRLAAGPDLPPHLPEPLTCSVPDEAPAGSDLFVHCAARSDVKANVIAFYYRSSGGLHYNSLAMEKSKKGWHSALIPAENVRGKLLQYYAEARDARGAVAAATGKPASPNILTLRQPTGGGPRPTTVGRTAPSRR